MPEVGLSSPAFVPKNGWHWPPVFIFRTHDVTFCVNLEKVKPRHDAFSIIKTSQTGNAWKFSSQYSS
ncbi:hypothetical protein GRH07_003133 [Salmonella bongori]|nr:hypothetical protein [Salmonella bongori]TNB51141.1 hypothetical protein FGW25_15260 [Salmonella bongori serovar 48:z35:-]EDP8592540.1 hypothetical protein [Salmonella bongori]EDP8597179.1 hypothetical protein [Salmonella bongori]EDP8630033.1 hypothetical protein [Salmonella bongori]